MNNPFDVGTKTIDAATIHCIRPLAAERTATLNTDKDFAFDRGSISSESAFIKAGISLENLVAAFARIGEELTLLENGETVRREWIASVKDFVSRPGHRAKFHSVVKFAHPESGSAAEEWLAARRDQITGATGSTASRACASARGALSSNPARNNGAMRPCAAADEQIAAGPAPARPHSMRGSPRATITSLAVLD